MKPQRNAVTKIKDPAVLQFLADLEEYGRTHPPIVKDIPMPAPRPVRKDVLCVMQQALRKAELI